MYGKAFDGLGRSMDPEDDPNPAVTLAKAILSMNSKLIRQSIELEELRDYKKKYDELLNQSLHHSEAMAFNQLKMLMAPGVVDAIQQHYPADAFKESQG